MLPRVMMLTLPLLTGCMSLDPHYQRPVAPVPADRARRAFGCARFFYGKCKETENPAGGQNSLR